MSLRAIQKRDRNKLTSAQQKQQQHQQQLFINKSRSFGTTPVATIGISSVGGGQLHRQSSSSSNSKNEKWRNSASQTSLSSSTSIPSSSVTQLTHAKRSVSYPSLQKRSSNSTSLRFTKSESDLHGQSAAAAANGNSGNKPDLSSANNLFLGAKSEVCLKTLAVKSTHQPPAPFRRQSSSSGHRAGSRMYESNRRTSDLGGAVDKLSGIGNNNNNGNGVAVRIPIIGYEVMEERARFTIFKLRIENSISHTCWLVLRRYTDFVRLQNRLRAQFPHCQLVLPRKKWFGDNFSSGFIDNRIQGLQTFINTILEDDAMRTTPAVREFFCLDEPPAYSESMEESRIIFEAQEETISHLKQQLQTKDELVAALQAKLASEINRNKVLTSVIRNSFENCSKCAKQLDNHLKDAAYK
uniref:Putative the phosphoinositide binding phox similarity domain of sorting nexin 16 n=1 Tax=Culex tarsalis TaxID=7177 RepID=A0A1Q3F6J7_CULTA